MTAIHHCPTCGGPVKVGGKGATHYYVPVRSRAFDSSKIAAEALAQVAANHPEVAFDGEDVRAIAREIDAALNAVKAEKRKP